MRLSLGFLFFITLMSLRPHQCLAQVISDANFDKETTRSLAFAFGSTYLKDPLPLGLDFGFEAQGSYIENQAIDSLASSSESWSSILTLRKGIYWNLHLNLNFLSPVNDLYQNGFAAGLGHSLRFRGGTLSSNVYVFSYNLNDVNQRGAGLTSTLYLRMTNDFYFGLGAGGEDFTSELQETSNFDGRSLKALTYRALASFLFTKKAHRFSIDSHLLNADTFSLSFSYGFRM